MYPPWAGLCWQGRLETRAMPNLRVWLGICSLRWHPLWRSGAGLPQPRDSFWRVLSSLSTNNNTTSKSKFILTGVSLVLLPSWWLSTSIHFGLDVPKCFSFQHHSLNLGKYLGWTMQLIILSLPAQFYVDNGHQNSRKGQREQLAITFFILWKSIGIMQTPYFWLHTQSMSVHENNTSTESKKIRELSWHLWVCISYQLNSTSSQSEFPLAGFLLTMPCKGKVIILYILNYHVFIDTSII